MFTLGGRALSPRNKVMCEISIHFHLLSLCDTLTITSCLLGSWKGHTIGDVVSLLLLLFTAANAHTARGRSVGSSTLRGLRRILNAEIQEIGEGDANLVPGKGGGCERGKGEGAGIL